MPRRAVLAALSVVLVAMLGGADRLGGSRPPTVIPARLGDAAYIYGDQLFVVGTGRLETGEAVVDRSIATYALPGVKLLDRSTGSVPGGIEMVMRAGENLLGSCQWPTTGTQAVVVLAAGTDRRLWQRSARLIAASPADGIALLGDDQAEFAVDLATGALRWTVPRPADGYFTEAGLDGQYLRWLVLVTDSGRLEVRDARTGRIVSAATIPAQPGRINGLIWPTDEFLVLNTGGSAGFDAYHLPDLGKRWHTTVDLSDSWLQAGCGKIICTYRQ